MTVSLWVLGSVVHGGYAVIMMLGGVSWDRLRETHDLVG